MVAQSSKFCPSSGVYSADAVKVDYGTLDFPALDSLSVDTLLFASILAVQVGFVIFAETQKTKVIATSILFHPQIFAFLIGLILVTVQDLEVLQMMYL
jgi:hypothetical protein